MTGKRDQTSSSQLLKGSWLERCLALCGVAALIYCGVTHLAAQSALHSAQAAERRTSNQSAAKQAADASPSAGVFGVISIPQLHLSAPITSGVGTLELIRGVGHIPGTALPGGLGTMALAGHRDTFFRSLRDVTSGMMIRVSGGTGTYRYQVESTEIVDPDQVSVLDIGSEPELVLITCYPFNYIGAAPRRFIVHAHLLSAASDEFP